MLNNSIGAPVPKSISSDTNKTPTPSTMSNFVLPEWVHCEICKRRESNGTNHTRLTLGYCHPCGHIICRDCAIKTVNNTCKKEKQYSFPKTKNSILSSRSSMFKINTNFFHQFQCKSNIYMFHSMCFLLSLVTTTDQSFVYFTI